jgi:hypothetical protein
LEDEPPQRYVARFACRGMIKRPLAEPEEVNQVFVVGIYLPDDYLRVPPSSPAGAGDYGRQSGVATNPVVNILSPLSVFHPNVLGPYLCLGRMRGGTSLVDILFQTYEILSYQKWTAHDGLNEAACEWARQSQSRFPLDRRPLKRLEAQQS